MMLFFVLVSCIVLSATAVAVVASRYDEGMKWIVKSTIQYYYGVLVSTLR